MSINKQDFIRFLLNANVLKFGDFTTKSGRQTPYFINTGEFRTGPQMNILAQYYAQLIEAEFSGKYDNLYGPAYKGIPLAVSISMQLEKDFGLDISYTFNRKEAKDHGEGGSLVGNRYAEKQKVVIVEDVTTAGTSIHETMEMLKNYPHIEVIGLAVSVNRMEKVDSGKSALQEIQEQYGIQPVAIIDIHDLMSFISVAENRQEFNIPEDALDRMQAYREKYGA